MVLDFDTDGRLVGIDVENAAEVADLSRVEAIALPIEAGAVAKQQT